MRAARLLLPTAFESSTLVSCVPDPFDRGTWLFTKPRSLRRVVRRSAAGVVFPSLADRPCLWRLWPRASPLALAAAAPPLVKACDPSATRSAFHRTGSATRGPSATRRALPALCVDSRRPFTRALPCAPFDARDCLELDPRPPQRAPRC